jgi:tyrosine-specific transport protein
MTRYGPALVGILLMFLCAVASGILISQLLLDGPDQDLPTLFRRHLGQMGAVVFNISYFCLAFCLLVAYWCCLKDVLHGGISTVMVFGFLMYYGLRRRFGLLGRLNSALGIGLIISFILFVGSAFVGDRLPLFAFANWEKLPMGLPIILCSFGYHLVIPTVCKQLRHNTRSIITAVIVGTSIPLIFNVVIVTLGFSLFTPGELAHAADLGVPVFVLLRERFNSVFFLYIGKIFTFFAISTSLLGVSIAMKGALRDISKSSETLKEFVEVIILLPLLLSFFRPQLFFTVLGLVGGIFSNLCAGLLPVLPFLFPGRFRLRYAVLWCSFASIFVIECVKLFQ